MVPAGVGRPIHAGIPGIVHSPLMNARRVERLLHDAALLSLELHEERAVLVFEPLRRSLDGGDLDDRRVKLELLGVKAVAIAYDPTWIHEKPSEFSLPPDVAVSRLSDISFPVQGAELRLDSPAGQEDLRVAASVHWFEGALSRLDESSHDISIYWGSGLPRIPLQLFIAYSDMKVFDPQRPLTLEVWEEQFAAWWRGWEAHWLSEARSEASFSAPVLEDAFIPAASAPPVLGHEPPNVAPFEVRDGLDTPSAILEPVREWFEGTHARDWMRVAAAFPDLDMSSEEQVRALAAGETDEGWPYARAIDGWWREGERAHVRVSGVQHYPPGDGEPAESKECVWDFALRLRNSNWYIHAYSEGCSQDGSADAIPRALEPWLAEFSI